MSNAVKLGAFVQATILNPATGTLSIYDPLVITQGTRPAVVPSVRTIPANAVVTIDFGFNGKDLFQVGAMPTTLADANCVNGQAGSIFGQVSFCNGINFFNAVKKDEREGLLKVPSPGTSNKIVSSGGDMGTGQVCVLDRFLDPVLGCTPFQAADLANNDVPTTSWALDEILSGAHQPRIAVLVPENDEMVRSGDDEVDAAKTDMYREELGQPPVSNQNNTTSDPEMYCQNIVDIQTPLLVANQTLLATGQSPVTAVGDNRERRGRGGRGDLQHLRADGDRRIVTGSQTMHVQEVDEGGQRAESDVRASDAAEPGPAVPEAWRSKRLRICVDAAAGLALLQLEGGKGRPFSTAPVGNSDTLVRSANASRISSFHVPGEVYDTAVGTTGRENAVSIGVGTWLHWTRPLPSAGQTGPG